MAKKLKFVDLYNQNNIFLGCSLQTKPTTIYNIHRDPRQDGKRLARLLAAKDYSNTKEGWYLTSIDFTEGTPIREIESFYLSTDLEESKGIMAGLLCLSGLPMSSRPVITSCMQENLGIKE